MQDENDLLDWKNKYCSTFFGSTKKITKSQKFRKLRSLLIEFLKNYCLLMPKFRKIQKVVTW
jgi:hypothetical protein